MQQQKSTLSYESVLAIAKAIGQHDFRASVGRYAHGDNPPWIITIGENDWQRHLVVIGNEGGGKHATLALLAASESKKSVLHLDPTRVERTITLHELTAESYAGIRRILYPQMRAAA